MRDAYVALQILHVALLEDVPHEAKVFSRVNFRAFPRRRSARGRDSSGILATMLQRRQAIEKLRPAVIPTICEQ
jgi:hypothetical protein